MALKVQASFSAGELDPKLHERTTLQKYKTGLATARNTIVGKNGGIMSRMGRKYCDTIKVGETDAFLYSPEDSGYLLEWGALYVRVYSFDDSGDLTVVGTAVHTWTIDEVKAAHYETSGIYVYASHAGKTPLKIDYTTATFASSIFAIPTAPTNGSVTAHSAPSGYNVDYAVTYVKAGQESDFLEISSGSLPVSAGQSNTIDARVATSADASITEMRVYRRPRDAGAFGYIGSTSYKYVPSGTNQHFAFEDVGQSADYTHQPPATVVPEQTAISDLQGKTLGVYQQRLLLTSNSDKEALIASRPGYQNNFYRDFPLSSDSALKFKSGTSGYAKVLRIIDSDGLVVFTSAGIYLNMGVLSPTNIGLDRKGRYRINENVPPLAIPGGVFFVDRATNSVRVLSWSTEAAAYLGDEVSIFSNHLFTKKEVTSWAFHEGSYPLLWVTFDDGTFASLTYQYEQEMRAWTRHDSEDPVQQVCQTGKTDITYFLMKSGVRCWIECTLPRTPYAAEYDDDPEVEMGVSCAAMDCVHTFKTLLTGGVIAPNGFTITEITVEDPDYVTQNAYLEAAPVDAPFTQPGYGDVGTVFRWFNPVTLSKIDLEIVAHVNNYKVEVKFSSPFPKIKPGTTATSNLVNPRLYETINVVSGVPTILGENLSVIVDGNVVASPNNNDQNYTTIDNNGGDVTLPNGMLGAIIHIGKPITYDIETLDVDTVEQAPTLIESITCNKLYVKVHESRGLYVGNTFGPDDSVTGMYPIDNYLVDYTDEIPIIGDRRKPATTRRLEMTVPGDWKSQGRVAFRQVDPLHFEILSIIPDLDVIRRSGN